MWTKFPELIGIVLVVSCLLTSVVCFARIFILSLRTDRLSKRFRRRLAAVDPKACGSIHPFWGIPSSGSVHDPAIKEYIEGMGNNADPELVELEKKINVPVKHILLTVWLIPGGFLAAIAVVYVFENILK